MEKPTRYQCPNVLSRLDISKSWSSSLSLSSLYPSHFSLALISSSSSGVAVPRGRASAREERRPSVAARRRGWSGGPAVGRRRTGSRSPPPPWGARDVAAVGAGRGSRPLQELAVGAAVPRPTHRRRASPGPLDPAAGPLDPAELKGAPDPADLEGPPEPAELKGAPPASSGGARGGPPWRAVELEKAIHGGDRAHAAELEEGRGRAAPWTQPPAARRR